MRRLASSSDPCEATPEEIRKEPALTFITPIIPPVVGPGALRFALGVANAALRSPGFSGSQAGGEGEGD